MQQCFSLIKLFILAPPPLTIFFPMPDCPGLCQKGAENTSQERGQMSKMPLLFLNVDYV